MEKTQLQVNKLKRKKRNFEKNKMDFTGPYSLLNRTESWRADSWMWPITQALKWPPRSQPWDTHTHRPDRPGLDLPWLRRFCDERSKYPMTPRSTDDVLSWQFHMAVISENNFTQVGTVLNLQGAYWHPVLLLNTKSHPGYWGFLLSLSLYPLLTIHHNSISCYIWSNCNPWPSKHRRRHHLLYVIIGGSEDMIQTQNSVMVESKTAATAIGGQIRNTSTSENKLHGF